jgi:hypothetical protein
MFDRLRELYRHEHELAALDALADPSGYGGLQKLDRRDLEFQVVLLPSFEPFRTWTVYQGKADWIIRRMSWHQREDWPLTGPELFGADGRLDLTIGDDLVRRLAEVRVPAFAFPSVFGIDGTTYGVRKPANYHRAELFWWSHPPEGWEELAGWHEAAIAILEATLPEPTPTK